MNNYFAYKKPLLKNTTLEVFNNDELIFKSIGKWLNPLFDLEKFLSTYSGSRENLCAHDTAVGKAAAVLMLRLGVKNIYANLASSLALDYVAQVNKNEKLNISFEYESIVDRLLCATEEQLENISDGDEMYSLLRQRAKLVQGVSVSVKNISYKFGAIKNLSFEVNAGGRLMVIGENGAGKTTLLRLLTGIYKPSSGTIQIDGKNISSLPKYTIGYIAQSTDNTQFSLSVEEVVSLGLPSHTKNKSDVIKKTLARTSSLNLYGRSFASLSGGEKQKVSMARCLAQNAKLLLLDEPTASLDLENKNMVMNILRSLTITEIPTIIVVTHDKDLYSMHGWNKLRIGENE